MQKDNHLITVIFLMLGPQVTLYCMPESRFANRTNEVVWINATKNWLHGYYKNVSSDIFEEMFVTTESRGYNKISEYTQILYSMEIIYRTRAVEDNLVKKKHGILLGFEVNTLSN